MPKPRVISETQDFPIKPADIDANQHLWDAFENQETEISAHYILLLMQRKDDWLPFTYKEIEQLYNESGHTGFAFNHMIGEFRVQRGERSWSESLDVIVGMDGIYFVTDDFILRCYRSQPILRHKVREPVV